MNGNNGNFIQKQQQQGHLPPQQYQQHYGATHTPSADQQQLLNAQLAQLQREKGGVDGMVQIMKAKLSELEDDNFELRANVLTIEAEAAYTTRKKEEQLKKQMASMESRLSFLTDQLKNAERVKLRALREVEELQQKQLLEQKRLDAEKRLLATKKRKHESVMIAASQTLMTRIQQQSSAPSSQTTTPPSSAPNHKSSASTSSAAIQTDPQQQQQDSTVGYAQENAELLSKLMSSFSRDLLTLFNGANGAVTGSASDGSDSHAANPIKPPTPTVAAAAAMLSSTPHSSGSAATQPLGYSQSVFSQIAGQAHAQAQASMLSFAMETNLSQAAFATERAKDLYDTLGKMLNGETTVLALAPVFIKYLAAPTDLDVDVLSSVMRVMYFVMHHSERFQQFLLISATATVTGEPSSSNGGSGSVQSRQGTSSSLMDHPRISLPGLKFASLDDYLASKNDHKWLDDEPSSAESASELKQQRAKLLSALCRVIRNYVSQPVVVENGLCVLSFWVDLGISTPSTQPDFKPLLSGNVIQDIVLAPKGPPHLKSQALSLLTQLLHFHDIFPEVEASAKKSLLFNRCAKMLLAQQPTGGTAITTSGSGSSTSSASSELSASRDMKMLQLQIVHVLHAIALSFPSTGIRFVLETTRGHANDADGHRSVIYYLAQLLHHETFEARITMCTSGIRTKDDGCCAAEQRLLSDPLRVRLVRDAFALLSLLVRFVDLGSELDGADHSHAFTSVLHWLSATRFGNHDDDDISQKTARALLAFCSTHLI